MKLLVDEQQNLLIRAVTSCGEYRLHPAVFKDFEVSHSEWFALPETDRANLSKSFVLLLSNVSICLRVQMSPACLEQFPTVQATRSGPESYEEAIQKCTNIPKTTLEHILKKAKHILSDENAVTTAPIKGIARMVKSRSHPNQPHIVRVLTTKGQNCM